MNVHFNTVQPAAAPAGPQATVRQAAKDGESSDSSISSSSSSGKGFIATILSPFKAIASFIASIFSKIFCCCSGDSKEVKALKEQKAALETFQKAMQAALDRTEGADYDAAVAALPQDVKDAVLADLKGQCDAKWEGGEVATHQRYAETMLNKLGDIIFRLPDNTAPGSSPIVAIDAVEAVKAAVTTVLADIDAQLKK